MPESTTPKARTIYLLQEALDTGIRGDLRAAVEHALETATNTHRDLTTLAYDRLKLGKELVDPMRPGFMMRANKSSKRWIYRFSWKEGRRKRQLELGLGTYPDTSLAQAREQWGVARKIRLSGLNPIAEIAGGEEQEMVWAQLQSRYLRLASQHKRSWKDDETLLKASIPDDWSALPLSEIDKYRVGALVATKVATPRQQQRLLGLLKTMFGLAMANNRIAHKWLPGESESGVVEAWAQLTENPCESVVLGKHVPKVYSPSAKEIRSFVRKLPALNEAPDNCAALKLQLLTNTRIGEVAQVEANEVDMREKIWTLPAAKSKNKTEHRIMLSDQATDLLQEQLDKYGDGYLFRNSKGGAARNDTIGKTISNNRQALGVSKDFVTHSLRHFGQSWLAKEKCPVEVRDRIANHAINKLTHMASRYNSYQYDQDAKEWLQKLADHVMALEADNIVLMEEATGE
jgi:integrase